MLRTGKLALLLILVTVGCTVVQAETFTPDFRVNPDGYTVLVADDAQRSSDLKRGAHGAHGKFPVEQWRRAAQSASWEITLPEEDSYAVNVLICRPKEEALELSVGCGTQQVVGMLPAAVRSWTRQPLEGALRLPKGKQTLTLKLRSPANAPFDAQVLSIELVRPVVQERLHMAALQMRADTQWLQQAKFGLMCHWTSQSVPRHGEPKPYAQAVQDFDVEALATQVQETGAGFLVLTTSHAQMFFPAPIQALERALPGRTSSRDLVSDLADAFKKRGLRLMLYYHIGAASDPAWLKASGFWETDTRKVFDTWTSIIQEVGERYKDRLAGWWFDDGTINYYYRSAPWERLTRTAKAGHPERLVAYNPWILPSATEFQDYHCGEGFSDPGSGGLVVVHGDGRYTGGTYQGLQACATLTADGDWVHTRKDTEVGRPHWTAAKLAALLKDFAARKNVPIFNFEIYQEGRFSPASVEVFKEASHMPAK